MGLGEADLAGMPEKWSWPEPVTVKAADGSTDLYGLVYRPSDFDPAKTYPVLAIISASPDIQTVPKASFNTGVFGGTFFNLGMTYAELGFIVVQLDTRGTPSRKKAFLNESYGWVDDCLNTADLAVGIQQLAKQDPSMDLDRVGAISPGGGIGVIQCLMQQSELMKVGVANCPHDTRLMAGQMFGEKFEGRQDPSAERQYPEDYVSNLKGKLLFVCGLLDVQTPAAIGLRVIDALHQANKDFDMLMLPKLNHDGMHDAYTIRRMWDYLVLHLAGETPPKEFDLSR